MSSCLLLPHKSTATARRSRRHQQCGICMLGPLYSAFGYWTDRQTFLLQRSALLPSPLIECTRQVEHSAIWISARECRADEACAPSTKRSHEDGPIA
jgi:hypothetical protein